MVSRGPNRIQEHLFPAPESHRSEDLGNVSYG